MAVKEIKTRFKLEGEQQFKKAMSDSAAAVKVLNSEEKLAEAQFHATGDAQTYAAEKSRILKEQIKQQESAVKAAEDAVKKLTEQGVQPNSREMQNWKTKLNDARTKLTNMQTKLDNVQTELGEQKDAVKGAKDETEKYNSEMGKVAEGVNLQNTITAIDNLKGHIENVVKKAAQAAKAIWQMGVDSAQWADTVATESAKMGVDPETYQSWQYASRLIDTNVSDIAKSWTDIEKKLKEAEDETIKVGIAGKEVSVRVAQSSQDYKDAVTDQTKAAKEAAQATEDGSKTAADYKKVLKELGVSATDASGKVRTSNDIFWDAVDALHNITDATELEHKASQVFGNDWRNLQPLIQAGSKAYKELAQEGIDLGAVLSNDQVAQLGGFDDAMQKVEAQSEALKNKLMAGLSPTFEEVANALSEANKALSDFLASEEGQAAIAGLNEALKGIIDSFLGEDNGKGTFESIVTGAKDAVTKLTDALDWISQHGEVVSGIITGMGAAWAGLTVTKEVLLFMQLLKATPLSKLGALFGGGAAKAGADAASAAAPAVASGAKAAVGGLSLGNLASFALPAAVTAAAVAPAVIADTQDRERAKAETLTTIERAETAAQGLGEEADAFVQMITHAAQALGVGDKKDIFGQDVLSDPAKVHEALKEAYQLNFSDVLDQSTQDQLTRFIQGLSGAGEGLSGQEEFALLQNITNQLMGSLEQMQSAGADAGNGLAAGLDGTSETVTASAEALGENASVGLANGINARAGEALSAAQSLAEQVTAIMREALQIHSPSRVFEQMGEFTGAGFALGIERSVADVNRAAGRMVGAVSGAARITPAAYSGGGWSVISPAGRAGLSGAAGAFPEKVQVTVMVDKDVLAETTVPLVDAKMGARLNAVRR